MADELPKKDFKDHIYGKEKRVRCKISKKNYKHLLNYSKEKLLINEKMKNKA